MDFYDAPKLENQFVQLEPLGSQHGEALAEAAADGELWRTWYTTIPHPERVDEFIDARLANQAAGRSVEWAIIVQDRAVGMTTYLNIEPEHRRLEIGSTWLSKRTQGTATNPATKLLLLTRAFEDLDCIAVEFRVNWNNQQSRAAVAKLGAKQDGILRNHRILPDGILRDTVVFSIIGSEWPAVKRGLQARLDH